METLEKVYSIYPTRGLKCDGCNLGKDYYSDGYRCFRSGLFFHHECAYSSQDIYNLYHPQHMLNIKVVSEIEDVPGGCKLCRGKLPKMYYYCSICDFAIDLICAKKEVTMTIESPKSHEHPLYLVSKMIMFTCHICERLDDRFPYVCNLCDLSFHKVCAESTPEIQYSCHPKHSLKRLTRVPSYTDGKCCLCRSKLHFIFYHCSICNFSVDVDCAKNPPSFTLFHRKAHEHQLTLLTQRTFVCNACGMDDNPNSYICPHCNFMIHVNCIDIPHTIKTNRHVHRIHYNQCLNPGEWKCGVCQREIIWTCGAYSCLKCPGFAIHFKCATKFGIWDGIEHEKIVEDNTADINLFKVIEEGVINCYGHEKHILKLKEESDAKEEYMWCNICISLILYSPFYECMECDDFIIHEKCAYLPKKITDSFHKLSMTLNSSCDDTQMCNACQNFFQGSAYRSDNNKISLDVRCGSISEPFIHESHPHPLYVNYLSENKLCNACGEKVTTFLSCEVCGYVIDIKCSTLPKMVKHKNDNDHLLSLCYGETKTEQYLCEMCEEDLNPDMWFYSCDHCNITSHIRCTVGDFIWIKPGKDNRFNVIPNNRVNRPICIACKSRCKFPSILKFFEKYTFCSLRCFNKPVEKRT